MDINQKNISLYVSCDGCDECGNGSIEKPFATVAAAQKVVRDAITITEEKTKSKPVIIGRIS